MRVEWSPQAAKAGLSAVDYFAADRPRAATAWLDDLLEATRNLETFAEMGRVVDEVGRDDIRELLHDPYRLIYRVELDRVAILLVLHMRQELDPDSVDLG